jgi:hypothetical protein
MSIFMASDHFSRAEMTGVGEQARRWLEAFPTQRRD